MSTIEELAINGATATEGFADDDRPDPPREVLDWQVSDRERGGGRGSRLVGRGLGIAE